MFDMPVSEFLRLVDVGAMPKPKRIGTHERWSFVELNAVVRVKGLEPPRFAAPEPKCSGYLASPAAWRIHFPRHSGNKSRIWETANPCVRRAAQPPAFGVRSPIAPRFVRAQRASWGLKPIHVTEKE